MSPTERRRLVAAILDAGEDRRAIARAVAAPELAAHRARMETAYPTRPSA